MEIMGRNNYNLYLLMEYIFYDKILKKVLIKSIKPKENLLERKIGRKLKNLINNDYC